MATGPTRTQPGFELAEIGWLLGFVALLFIGIAPFFAALGRWAMIPMQLVVLAAPPLVFAYTRTGSWPDALSLLGVKGASGRAFLGAVLIGASFWLMSSWLVVPVIERLTDITEAERQLRESLALDRTPLIVTLFTVALLPAFCEELLLRGVVARGLRPYWGVAGALVASSLLFGLMHLDLARLAPMILFGLILGVVAIASDSCVPAMVVHFLNNAIVLSGDRIPGLESTLRQHPHVAGAAATALCLTGVIISWNARLALPSGSESRPSSGETTPS